MKNIFIILIAVILCSCMPTRQEVKEEWTGKHISEAIAELGPPDNTMEIHGGITIYTWEREYGKANQARRPVCKKGLHVNKDGLIIDASQVSESLMCK